MEKKTTAHREHLTYYEVLKQRCFVCNDNLLKIYQGNKIYYVCLTCGLNKNNNKGSDLK